MENRIIYFTKTDYERIINFLHFMKNRKSSNLRQIAQFESDLAFAVVTSPEKIPSNVVTLNTKVRIKDIAAGRQFVYTIVLPKDADIKEGRISILAPLGMALIGHKVGNIVEYSTQNKNFDYLIEEILYQPESNGVYTL